METSPIINSFNASVAESVGDKLLHLRNPAYGQKRKPFPADDALIKETPATFDHKPFVNVKAKEWSAQDINAWVMKQLHKMDLPAAYLGDEPNTWHKDWNDPKYLLRLLLVGGMSYSASEGNLAIPLLYSQVNHLREQYISERFFFWNGRSEYELFKEANLGIFGLETKHPAHEFDVLAFSISYIMPFIHIPLMLARSGIPIYANERGEHDPIIIVGGCMSPVSETLAGGNGGICDIHFIGESEDGFCELLDRIQQYRKEGLPREEILFRCTTEQHGVYVPKFYDVLYDPGSKEIVKRTVLRKGVPEKIRKAFQRNMDVGFRLVDPFLSFKGGMAMGNYEIARGCSSACSFCQEAHTYRPYRERGVETAVKDMKEMLTECGATAVLPAAFTASDHRQINQMTKRLLEEVSEDVAIVSQRADAFGSDETFARLTSMGGSHTVSIGCEGVSQRLRDAMNKAVSEDELLRSIEFAIKNSYSSVKLFMIANVPGTVEDDYHELMSFAKKIKEMRDNYNSKCEVKFSFTPLFMSGHTPYQWAAVTVDERTLTPWIRKLKEMGMGFRLGSGARKDESYASQLLHLGDRRLTKVMVRAALQDEFLHYGATPKGTIQKWTEYMKEDGVDFPFFFQEKHEHWNFSWDHFDLLTKKEALWSQYQRALAAVGQVAPCIEECYECGACDTDTWLQRKGWDKQRKADTVDVNKVHPIRQTGEAQRIRVRIEIDGIHRYVEMDHWKYQIRRACYKEGIPIDKHSIVLASSAIKIQNWISGVDYVDFKLTEHILDKQKVMAALNKHLVGARATHIRLYNNVKQLRSVRDCCLYEMHAGVVLPKEELEGKIATFLALPRVTEAIPNDQPGRDGKVPREIKSAFMKKYPQVIRIKRMGFRGIERVMVDLRAAVDDAWVIERPDGNYFQLKLRGEISPYDAYAGIFRTKWKTGFSLPAGRQEFLLEKDDDQDSFIISRCQVCENNIEENLFGEVVDGNLCLRHKFVQEAHDSVRDELKSA